MDAQLFVPPVSPPHDLVACWVGNKRSVCEKGLDLIQVACEASGVRLIAVERDANRDRGRVLSHEELRDSVYHQASFYVCASRVEGTPNPALEALACGLPVISTRVGNMPELLRDGYNGFLVDRSVEGIRGGIRRLGSADRRAISANARASVLDGWTWRQKAENYVHMLRGVAQAQRCTRAPVPTAVAAQTANSGSGLEQTPAPPLVSVIVPTFNRPEQLCTAVRSALAQTYPNVEVVVVNDGGIDVAERLASLASCRVVYVQHAENRGLAASRNTGIRASRGKYIAYLDDDDRFYPEHVATLVEALESGPHRVAYTDAYRTHEAKRDGAYVTTGRDLPYSDDFDADRLLECNFLPVLCVAHARECLDLVGVFDESLKRLEDWDLWIRMSRKYAFKHVPKVTGEFSWRTDGSTMTSNVDDEFEAARQRILRGYGNAAGQRARAASLEQQLAETRRAQPRTAAAALEEVACSVAVLRARRAALVWGAGAGGRRARHLLEAFGLTVEAFVDADPGKAGTLVDGLPVMQPPRLAGRNEGLEAVAVAVASVAHAAIAAKLDALGWRRGRDYTVLPAAALLEP